MADDGFTGFPREGRDFLAALAENNRREWFAENRDAYDRGLIEPAKAFVVALGERLRPAVGGDLHAEPRVNGSIFRINRDTRFSSDKTPYKTTLDMMLWRGEGRSRERSGFFLRVAPDHVGLGGGMHGFDREALARYRDAVADEASGAELSEALATATGGGVLELGGEETYKRVPRGYDPDSPRAGLLRRDAIFVRAESPVPVEIEGPEFVGWCAERLILAAPVVDWLQRHVTG